MILAEFLLACIAEDEARVRPMLSEAWPEEVVVQSGLDGDREPCVTVGPQESPKAYLRVWRPGTEHQVEFGWQAHGVQVWGREVAARVLAECAAKRTLVKDFARVLVNEEDVAYALAHHPRRQDDRMSTWGPVPVALHVLQMLALPYAEHPDYREEWRP